MVLLKVLFMLFLLAPTIPACFFFMNPLAGRYPKNWKEREWIIGITSLAYVPVYFWIIHRWPDLH
jgi:hypothetical protein